MKCLWMKKTITKNQQCSDPFSILPLDLIVEILMKLPVKSIAMLIFVSKHLSSIIRSKEFTTLHMTRSSTRPRFLFQVVLNNMLQVLESCSQEDPNSDHQKVNITPRINQHVGVLSQPVRGLICYSNETKVMIGNPSTGQFLTLPRIKFKGRILFSFFGYDSVNDVHKVLCITVRKSGIVSDEHQVFTLGSKKKWKKIKCKHPHRPFNAFSYINGVVYYYAWIKDQGCLICFDFTSEDFSVVKLPADEGIPFLANYGDKLAINRSDHNDTLMLWVLQDAKKHEWLQVSILVPNLSASSFMFKGTLSTGQLIFAPLCFTAFIYAAYFLISYDPKENNAKTVVIEGIGERYFIDLYIDHVESPMILSNL